MDGAFVLWLFSVSVAASAFGGMLGMAGGIFVVPVLAIFGHIDIHAAIAASLVSVIACSCGSAATFLREGLTNIRLAIILEMATTLGALTGVLASGFIPVRWLFVLFAAILLISAKQMMTRRREPPQAQAPAKDDSWSSTLGLNSSYPDESGGDIQYGVTNLSAGMGLMYGAGLVSALLGIGSGVLKIPAMDTALRLPLRVSSATSNFMIGVTAAASAGAYYMRGSIDPGVAGPVALGSVAGSILGAHILMRVSSAKLRLLFVLVLIALATQMLFSALGAGTTGLPR
jgi:uncharacterized membrane protein YfcA